MKDCQDCKKAFQMLSIYGVPKERAKYVSTGIMVLMDRISTEDLFKEQEITQNKQTFINILQGCRTGLSRKDICDFARNALSAVDMNSVKIMDNSFEKQGKPKDWYFKIEE